MRLRLLKAEVAYLQCIRTLYLRLNLASQIKRVGLVYSFSCVFEETLNPISAGKRLLGRSVVDLVTALRFTDRSYTIKYAS
jgi:hypothetical protein